MFKKIDMKKENMLRIINICLAAVLLVVLVVIVMVMLGSRSASNEYQKALEEKGSSTSGQEKTQTEVNDSGSTKATGITNSKDSADNTDKKEGSISNQASKDAVVSNTTEDLSEKKVDDSGTKTDEQEIVKESSKSETKENDEKTKEYTGILEKADENKNDYEGNYKIKLEGNTEYTYFWFSGDFAKQVNTMVSKEVKVKVKYSDDGTFTVLEGPTLVD